MSDFISQLFTLVTTPPGNLIYHLVLAFSIVSALQAAFVHWRSSRFPQVRRAILGLSLLLTAQILLFIASGLAWQGILNPAAVLPPLNRAVTLFSLIWIGWLWAFPEPKRAADAGNILLSIFIPTALALDLISWGGMSIGNAYNATLQATLWDAAALAFLAMFSLILFVRRPSGWENGIAFLALSFAGHTLSLLLNNGEGDFSGAVRIFALAAYPILLTLPQRFPIPSTTTRRAPVTIKRAEGTEQPIRERRRYSTDPKTFNTLLALAAEVDAAKINKAIARAIAQTMLADLCFLIYLTEDKSQLVIASGYDLIREESLEGANLNKTTIPMLATSLQRGRPLRLPASSTSPDLQGLGELLGLRNPGHLLSVPITSAESKESIGGVLLLSPYSNRLWSAEDQAFLANISSSLVSIIQRGKRLALIKQKEEEAERQIEEMRAQIEDLRTRNQELTAALEEAREQLTHAGAPAKEVETLRATQAELQTQIEKLQRENEALRAAQDIAGKAKDAGDMDYIEKELRATLEEVARLQNALAEANIKILSLEQEKKEERPSEQAEIIASISQELRQPMSSIVGYTDLLLGESVGILGALQRKFIERIKTSTERIGNLIDDLIQITTLESNLAGLNPEPVDLNLIIDNAMTYTSSQIREKNISLNLELPKTLRPIYMDRDALQQILIHLLQNAGAATPVDGEITLRVQTQNEEGKEYILIQVTDSGGGIPSEDLPRVFSRLYRAENVLIQGVGDTGVGLSIAKTLTEAQHGRIWVETEMGKGSTFSVLLPIMPPENKPNSEH